MDKGEDPLEYIEFVDDLRGRYVWVMKLVILYWEN